jgi:nucleoside-diphosphate-sugar epimerase
VIIHQLTAIGALDMRHFDRDFAPTNRLRTEGTDHLLSAGQAVGVGRFVAQGIAGYGAYARTGGPVKSEEDPLDPTPASGMRETVAAIRHLEEAVLDARWTEGIVLRYGAFYGPGTSMAPDEEQFELVRKRKFPLVGDGGAVWFFIHVADAAEATVTAVEHGSRGVYNIVDDDPAPVAEWLPTLAQTLGAKKRPTVAAEVGQSGWRRPLASGQAARISAALLASLQPLQHGERIVVQWILAPTGPVTPPVVAQGQARRSGPLLARALSRLAGTPTVDAATAQQIRSKQASALFVATGRIGATALTTTRARPLRARVIAALHTANAPGAHLYRALWPSWIVRKWLYARTAPLLRQLCLVNTGELAGLVAWPLGDVSLPGLSLGSARALAPPSDIPSHGRVVMRSTYLGMARPLATAGGPALVEDDGEPYAPTLDLLALANSVAGIFEADEYRITDITTGTDIAPVWLPSTDPRAVGQALERVRACLSVSGAPHADAGAGFSAQRFLTYLAECATPEEAALITQAAKQPAASQIAALAVSHDTADGPR